MPGRRGGQRCNGTWIGAVTGTLPAVPDATGWLWGTDLTLLRDGVVVGVQEAGGAPDDLAAVAAASEFATSPFPQATYASSTFVACDPRGGPVGEGTYELVVTQTVAAEQPDGTRLDARASERTSVTVTPAEHAESPGATECGAADDELHRLADPVRNPAPVSVTAEVPAEVGATTGEPQVDVTVRYTGSDQAVVSSGTPAMVLTRDGVVVGGVPGGASGTGPGAWVTVGGGGPYRSCTSSPDGTDVRNLDAAGAALPPGTYELWAVTTAHLTTPSAHDAQVAGGPWPVTLVEAPATTGG